MDGREELEFYPVVEGHSRVSLKEVAWPKQIFRKVIWWWCVKSNCERSEIWQVIQVSLLNPPSPTGPHRGSHMVLAHDGGALPERNPQTRSPSYMELLVTCSYFSVERDLLFPQEW